jgi:hypothetical protein
MGRAIMLGFCAACGRHIEFNPHKVPSLMIEGKREPICKSCAERWNILHPENAKPIQEGAYDSFDENEL